MKMTKKVLGVVLAIAMLANIFAMFSFAAAPDSACDLGLSLDKASYAPGDIVTITASVKVEEEVGDMRIGGRYAYGYDSSVMAPISTSQDLPDHNFVAIQAGSDVPNSMMNFTEDCLIGGDTIDTGYNWDSIFLVGVTDDNGATQFSATAGVDLFTFQMKIADDAAPGEYVFGYNKGSYDSYNGYINDVAMGGIYGTDQHYYSTTDDYSFGTVKFTVEGATEASFIKDGGAQIRFRGIGSTGTVADYQGEFDVRTVATISQDDFVANFGSDENAIAKITDIGFVYATAANVPTFDLATAKAVAEGTASEGYVKKAVQSIQHAGDGEVYKFTCLIENIADADKEQTVNALAYVCFDGTYYYFDAAATVDFAALYERMPK